jgi:hypothetical protein
MREDRQSDMISAMVDAQTIFGPNGSRTRGIYAVEAAEAEAEMWLKLRVRRLTSL